MRQMHAERASGGRHGKVREVGFETAQRHERIVAELDFVEHQKRVRGVGLLVCEGRQIPGDFAWIREMLEHLARLGIG